MNNKEKKSTRDWISEIPDEFEFELITYDGWDLTSFNHSFYKEKITKEEFIRRLNISSFRCANIEYKLKTLRGEWEVDCCDGNLKLMERFKVTIKLDATVSEYKNMDVIKFIDDENIIYLEGVFCSEDDLHDVFIGYGNNEQEAKELLFTDIKYNIEYEVDEDNTSFVSIKKYKN